MTAIHADGRRHVCLWGGGTFVRKNFGLKMINQAVSGVYSVLGGDPDLGELVEMFAAEMPERLENLIRQHGAGNRPELCRAVHQIKGAAGSYGFHAVTPLAARLEWSLQNDGPEEQITAELTLLLELCRRLRGGREE